tara:strand:+ start:1991 stop:2200 length:210 start_codon:yes stop_codon:yes gene_type:complete
MVKVVNHFLQWRWFIVAAIVGTALNLINQWDALTGSIPIDYGKLILTYIVPYLVSSLSAWQARRQRNNK